MRGRAHQGKPPFDTKKHVLDFYNQICFPPYETKMTEEDGEVTMFFTSPERPNPADLIEMDFPPRKEADPKTPKSVVKVLSSQRSKDILDSAPPTCAETKRFLEWSELPRIHPMMIRYRILALMQAGLESGLPELLGAVSTPQNDIFPTHILTSSVGSELARHLPLEGPYAKLPTMMVQIVNTASSLRAMGVFIAGVNIGTLGLVHGTKVVWSNFDRVVCCNNAFPCISNQICNVNSLHDVEMAIVEGIGEVYANMLIGMRIRLPLVKVYVAALLQSATTFSSSPQALKDYFHTAYHCNVSFEECAALIGMIAPHPPIMCDGSCTPRFRRWSLSEVVTGINTMYHNK